MKCPDIQPTCLRIALNPRVNKEDKEDSAESDSSIKRSETLSSGVFGALNVTKIFREESG